MLVSLGCDVLLSGNDSLVLVPQHVIDVILGSDSPVLVSQDVIAVSLWK